MLGPWTSQLVEAGVRISADREEFLNRLSPVAAQLHSQLTGGTEQLSICYSSSLSGAEDDQQREATFREELERHVEITANGRSLRRYGSQGQQRTAALSLKLAEAQVIGQRRGELPILLLDDCFSELDNRRARWLLELLGSFPQVLVTSAGVTESLREADWASWYELGEGAVKQAQRGVNGDE